MHQDTRRLVQLPPTDLAPGVRLSSIEAPELAFRRSPLAFPSAIHAPRPMKRTVDSNQAGIGDHNPIAYISALKLPILSLIVKYQAPDTLISLDQFGRDIHTEHQGILWQQALSPHDFQACHRPRLSHLTRYQRFWEILHLLFFLQFNNHRRLLQISTVKVIKICFYLKITEILYFVKR